MSNRFDLLAQQLFQKTIEDCSVEELEEQVQQYPYFAPLQYILLKKYQSTHHTAYPKQYQKAILYYHNPLAFDHFINEENYHTELTEPSEVMEPDPKPIASENGETPAAEVLVDHEKADVANLETALPPQVPSVEEPIVADATLPRTIQPQSSDEQLAFEPYHTVDYFASQGIKLSQEEATKDRFGKQLKSFTEWLKTMKKLPVAEQVKNIDVASERKVEHLAQHSVADADVVTEAMAEVWVKQGNREKAIDTYNKLSLLNPSKRAYFAAKAEFLKKEVL
jgi:tetratricopeptide (TPR) repeat protein